MHVVCALSPPWRVQIENKGHQALSIADRGMPLAGARAHLVPALHEGHTLKATWQLPPVQGLYRKKAEDYWSHLLGHEGPGSLLSALKARKWATTLWAGAFLWLPCPAWARANEARSARCSQGTVRRRLWRGGRARLVHVSRVAALLCGALIATMWAETAGCGAVGLVCFMPQAGAVQVWVTGRRRTTAGLRCLRWRSR